MTENDPLIRTASAAKSFFLGNILEQNLFPFPKPNPEELETLQMVVETVDRFMQENEEKFREFDVEGKQPDSFIESLKEMGLFGLIIPEEYGGIGLSNTGYSRVMQQASHYDAGTSITIGAHSSIGMKGLLLFGTDEQKGRYLPKLASGEFVAAFCLTEPGSGSDAASISTQAEKNSDGSWTLSGEKLWISNGGFAGFFTVFARTESEQKGKISAFLVERAYEGVSTGPKEDKMGIRGSNTTSVIFDKVRVPKENLLGEEGKGFKIAMSILNNGRTGLGGGSVGVLKACLKWATKQASERKQFGKAICEYGLIKEKLANMAVDCFAVESAVNMVSHYIDSGVEDYSVEAAISKVFATEAVWRGTNEALQIAGGNGFMREFPYERAVRDARINLIFEGTNEILRLFIALSGLKDAGHELKNVGKAASNVFNDPIKGFGVMSKYATKKISEFTEIGSERMELHPALRADARIFELGALGLGRVTDAVLVKHGKDMIGRQYISKRLADAAIDLFVGSCMLSRVNGMILASSEEKCKQELSIMKIFSQQAKRRLKSTLRNVEKEEDPFVDSLADFLVSEGGYAWDVI